MSLFHDNCTIEPELKPGNDYILPAWYHVTICTKGRVHYFGNIIIPLLGTPEPDLSNGNLSIAAASMDLSETGRMAEKYWNEIPYHFPLVTLDTFQIMPNHIHGIIQIADASGPDISTLKKHLRPELGNIINQFKRICSIKTLDRGLELSWQPRFHDQIISDDADLQRVRRYIRNNPRNWVHDKFNI